MARKVFSSPAQHNLHQPYSFQNRFQGSKRRKQVQVFLETQQQERRLNEQALAQQQARAY